MAKKKADKSKARMITTFTDTVELVSGDEPLTLSDLSALVVAAEILPDEARVELRSDPLDPATRLVYGVDPEPNRIRVTTSVVQEETL